MSVQKRAVAVLVAMFAVVGGVSYTASATTEPTDVTVSSEVMAVDAVDDVAKVDQESTVNVNVLGNDLGTNRKVTNFTQPANGEVKKSPEGGLRYTPNSGYKGLDNFSYTISDGKASDTAMVTVTVDPVDNPCQSNLNGLTGTVSFDKIHRTVTYKVVLPHPTCSPATLEGDTYMLPRSYDRSGEFNESATPARYNDSARSDITIPRGYRIAQTTKRVDTSFKNKWVMGVVYNGERQDVANMPGIEGTVASEVEMLPRVHMRGHGYGHHRW
ncbi:MAG TPA: Ig-like domain-containing protein [Candidatus Saccharimonadales bacterium]